MRNFVTKEEQRSVKVDQFEHPNEETAISKTILKALTIENLPYNKRIQVCDTVENDIVYVDLFDLTIERLENDSIKVCLENGHSKKFFPSIWSLDYYNEAIKEIVESSPDLQLEGFSSLDPGHLSVSFSTIINMKILDEVFFHIDCLVTKIQSNVHQLLITKANGLLQG